MKNSWKCFSNPLLSPFVRGTYRGSCPRRGEPKSVAWKTKVHEAERKVERVSYGQAIKVTAVGVTTYVDEGQGWGAYVEACPRRRALPGSSPVFWPWSITTLPLTMT